MVLNAGFVAPLSQSLMDRIFNPISSASRYCVHCFSRRFFAIRSPIVIESPPRKYDTLIPMIFPYPKTDFCTLFCVKKVHSALFILHFRKKVISR